MRVAMLQLNSRHDKAQNIQMISQLFEQAMSHNDIDLVVAPEYATYLGGSTQDQWAAGEEFPNGEGYKALQALAVKYKVAFHVGSMIETEGNKHYNSSIVFAADGTQLAKYRKIHLFDVETPGGHVFRESDVISRGDQVVDYMLGDQKIGCAICYDIRFSELFLAHMKSDCNVIVLPAAFNLETGKDHWEALIRARAIETQSFVIAPGQIGFHLEDAGERPCYGNSMIVDPWGTVVARASSCVGVTVADLDISYQKLIRMNLPSNQHHVM